MASVFAREQKEPLLQNVFLLAIISYNKLAGDSRPVPSPLSSMERLQWTWDQTTSYRSALLDGTRTAQLCVIGRVVAKEILLRLKG